MFLSYALIVLMLIVGLAPMLYELARGRFDFFNAKNPFIIYFLIQLAISGWLTLYTGISSPITLDPASHLETYEKALAISVLGLACFQFGYYTQAARPVRLPKLFRLQWRGNRFVWVVWGLVLVGYATFSLLMAHNGGLVNFLAHREAFRAGGLLGQGILMFPATTILCLAPVIYLLGRGPNPGSTAVVKSVLLLGVALVPAVILGFRSAIFLPILQFMVVVNYSLRRIRLLKLGVGLLVIMVGFTVYGIVREIPEGATVDWDAMLNVVREHPQLAYIVVSRSKGTEVVASVIHKLDRTHDYVPPWSGLFEAATIVVPRALWPGKPEPLSERFTTYFFGRQLDFSRGHYQGVWGGISPTIVGESYWYMGSFGVAIFLYLFGRLVKITYCTAMCNSWNNSVVMAYAILYTSFAMFAEAVQGYLNGLVMACVALCAVVALLAVRVHGVVRANETAAA